MILGPSLIDITMEGLRSNWDINSKLWGHQMQLLYNLLFPGPYCGTIYLFFMEYNSAIGLNKESCITHTP